MTKFETVNVAEDYTRNAVFYMAVMSYTMYFPCWQRRFIWEEENFAQFLSGVMAEKNLGTLYLYKTDSAEVLGNADGQQRCCALATLICAYNEACVDKCAHLPLLEVPAYQFKSSDMQRMFDNMRNYGEMENTFKTGFRYYARELKSWTSEKLQRLYDAIMCGVRVHIEVLKNEGEGFEMFLACNSYCQKMTSEDIIKSLVEQQMQSFGVYQRFQEALSRLQDTEGIKEDGMARFLLDIVKMYYCWHEIEIMSAAESFFHTGAGYNYISDILADMTGVQSFLAFLEDTYDARQTSAYAIAKVSQRSQLKHLAQFLYMKKHNPDTDYMWQKHVFTPAFVLSISTQIKGQLANGHIQANLDNIVLSVLCDESARAVEKTIFEAIENEPEVYGLTMDMLERNENRNVIRSMMLMYQYVNGHSVKDIQFVAYIPSKLQGEWEKFPEAKDYASKAGNFFMVKGGHRIPAVCVEARCEAIDKIALETVGSLFYSNPIEAVKNRTRRLTNKMLEINGMEALMKCDMAA